MITLNLPAANWYSAKKALSKSSLKFKTSFKTKNKLFHTKPFLLGTDPCFETGIKTPFKQPIADNLSVIGCLVSLNTNIVIIMNVFYDSAFYDGGRGSINAVKIERFRL